jgi:hypothetical protein
MATGLLGTSTFRLRPNWSVLVGTNKEIIWLLLEGGK